MEDLGGRIQVVRDFNRFYTNVIGALREGLLKTPYSLTEARVIFELAQRDVTELSQLRRSLDIDAGYLSRILARFEADGVATRDRSRTDGRRQLIRLTRHGKRAFAILDSRASKEVGGLLSATSEEDQRRLLAAMASIRQILEGSPRANAFVLRSPGPGDYGWVVQRHGVLYAEEYGWDETFEGLVAAIVSDYVKGHDPKRENAWIAEVEGEPVGCVFCVKKDDTTAQLRILLVEPRVRGTGIGSRLVEECIRFARRADYKRIVLWTNDVLTDARRIYERAGFQLKQEEAHHSFGHDLVGQYWGRDL